MFASTSAATKLPLIIAKLSVAEVSVMVIAAGVCRLGVSLAATKFTPKFAVVVTVPSETPKVKLSDAFAVSALIAALFGV